MQKTIIYDKLKAIKINTGSDLPQLFPPGMGSYLCRLYLVVSAKLIQLPQYHCFFTFYFPGIMHNEVAFIRTFSTLTISDIAIAGGKNASLGEMHRHLIPKGIRVPDGFAVTAAAYWYFIDANNLRAQLDGLFNRLDKNRFANLKEIGSQARTWMMEAVMPDDLAQSIRSAYLTLSRSQPAFPVAVRSSATAEDLPSASFAGQHESYLNVDGADAVIQAVHNCFASLFTDRAIKYREDNHFDHMKVALSVGIQQMVRSDLACSGISFTIEPETGFHNIILLSGVWGLGENIVQGAVIPDEYYVFKPALLSGKNPVVLKKIGEKAKTMVFSDLKTGATATTVNIPTPEEKRRQFVLTQDEIHLLGEWSLLIEQHYGKPMDIEWAKDGLTGQMFIVQARPETISSKRNPYLITDYILTQKGKLLTRGQAVGNKIASGVARVLNSPADSDKLQKGEILITDITSPDWDPVLKKAGAIVTNKGGRTSHAAIVARELGVVAVVGTVNATGIIHDGQEITVSCAESESGKVYEGLLNWITKRTDLSGIRMPETDPMLIVADPDKAFKLSFYPNKGVGLMRLEFVINNAIRIHPMALAHYDEIESLSDKVEIDKITYGYPDKKMFFIERLSEAVATIACAFYPKDVIVRMSDFKTNEYANLIGGHAWEPKEENPMIGYRGASRYYSDGYRDGFLLECAAMRRVRNEMGLTNVKLMIPFCRTVEEGEKVLALMAENGLKQGVNGLEVYVMVEIPSNVILAQSFAAIFDGFSIGSNDLTQLTLGVDRDSELIRPLFSENNPAVKILIAEAISKARSAGIKIGLCGQAPSDDPMFARFLVENKIDSIAFNPDALLNGIRNINEAEEKR
jgi:pyruvate,water dikinase